jgi:CRISPR-associated protein Cmr6
MSTRRNSLTNLTLNNAPNAHPELWLDKYITNQEDTKSRGPFIAGVSELPTSIAYPAFYQRWEQMLEDRGAKKGIARVKGRMIIGLGDESVLETAITLHRIYGVPYIPGSALKGLAANYTRQRLGETWEKGSEAYKIVFGDTDDTGYITFFDALYIPGTGFRERALYPDVITVHHQKYYQGLNLPADWDDPNPVPFLSATGSYLIALAGSELEYQQSWIEATFAILGHALAELGIGAKTSSGYGRMELEVVGKDMSPTNTTSLTMIQPKPTERIRPNIPKFREGQEITGSVVMPSDQLRQMAPDAKAFLRYQSFAITDVVIVVRAEEAQNWKSGETRICLFQHEEVRDGCTVLISQPRAKKKK